MISFLIVLVRLMMAPANTSTEIIFSLNWTFHRMFPSARVYKNLGELTFYGNTLRTLIEKIECQIN